MYVPDPDYISSVDSSPSLSPISPLSPTSSEAEFDKATVNVGIQSVTIWNALSKTRETHAIDGVRWFMIMITLHYKAGITRELVFTLENRFNFSYNS